MTDKINVKPPEIAFDKDHPSGKYDEIFECRVNFKDKLTDLVTNIEDGMTLGIDAQWGDGKTTFLRMWKNDLENKNIPCIFFDAFQSDYQEDPFIALAVEIIKYYEKDSNCTGKVKTLKEKTIKIGGTLAKLATKIVINIVSSGAVEVKDVKKLTEEIQTVVLNGHSTSEYVTQQIEDFKNRENLVTELKQVVSDLIKRNCLDETTEKTENTKGKLVFIVDELDRCEPAYALKVLERIKHFFQIDGVFFVIGVNKKQILSCVKKTYGIENNEQLEQYLGKFINYTLNLPKNIAKPGSKDDDYYKFVKYLDGKLSFMDSKNKKNRLFFEHEGAKIDFTVDLCRFFNLSLREIEDLYRNLTLCFSATGGEKNERILLIMLFFLVLKIKKSDVYEELKSKSINFSDLWVKRLELQKLELDNDYYYFSLKALLKFYLLETPSLDAKEIDQIKSLFPLKIIPEKNYKEKRQVMVEIFNTIDLLT